ncbi:MULTISPECIES: alpha/beta hydrolase [unclassified Crossiella]|uniref:alpha/beta hydrolase n=1 Tax=unclassified Crossiella TaxID=2620835 RepID=UPI001FFFBF7D|nr:MULTISPECIES: alpha/beta hydrolase [unclassified Crossiella]MCK2237849.1 alpha/beta fold hydrolase [Crossiella sp. S99.2]MCK2255135.1 alpha/beta fold hydrolase [Crossiella sp. S99.1]
MRTSRAAFVASLTALLALSLSPPLTAAPQSPQWTDCDGNPATPLDCATLRAPLDYRAPGGQTVELAISRIKAADPAKRHGVLLVNPGGPGGSGLDMPLGVAQTFPKDVLDRYDLIGFDPRFVGKSSPLSCGFTGTVFDALWPRLPGPGGFAAEAREARKVARQCEQAAGDLLPFASTRNAARDLDVIRAGLGERRISFYGGSYGTYLGAVYGQLFPDRVDRMVLDGAIDPAKVWHGMNRGWGPAAETAFGDWVNWAAGQDATYHFGATADAVRAHYAKLGLALDERPVQYGQLRLDGNTLREVSRLVLYNDRSDPVLAGLVADLADGQLSDPAVRGFLDAVLATFPADNFVSVFLAVQCTDADWDRNPARYAVESALDARRYPFFGAAAAGIGPCAYWSHRPLEQPTRIKAARHSAMVVGATGDSATPYSGAVSMRRMLGEQTRLVTLTDARMHGLYARYGNACVDSAVTGYLLGGTLPAKDLTCRK